MRFPRSSLHTAEALALEPVKLAWSDDDALEKLEAAAERASALAIGPGLGRSEARTALVRALLERIDLPTVVDADGLFALEPLERRSGTVLTPHAGELSRLLGRDSAWVDAHRLAAAQEGAHRFRAVVLLKGADTIIASPTGDVVVCDAGPPALATAGTGDVLTGVVASFLSKGLDADDRSRRRSVRARDGSESEETRGRARRERPPGAASVGARALTMRRESSR